MISKTQVFVSVFFAATFYQYLPQLVRIVQGAREELQSHLIPGQLGSQVGRNRHESAVNVKSKVIFEQVNSTGKEPSDAFPRHSHSQTDSQNDTSMQGSLMEDHDHSHAWTIALGFKSPTPIQDIVAKYGKVHLTIPQGQFYIPHRTAADLKKTANFVEISGAFGLEMKIDNAVELQTAEEEYHDENFYDQTGIYQGELKQPFDLPGDGCKENDSVCVITFPDSNLKHHEYVVVLCGSQAPTDCAEYDSSRVADSFYNRIARVSARWKITFKEARDFILEFEAQQNGGMTPADTTLEHCPDTGCHQNGKCHCTPSRGHNPKDPAMLNTCVSLADYLKHCLDWPA